MATQVHEISGGDVAVWLDEAGCVCIKSRDKHGDPVELSEDEALELAKLLTRLAEELKGRS